MIKHVIFIYLFIYFALISEMTVVGWVSTPHECDISMKLTQVCIDDIDVDVNIHYYPQHFRQHIL